MKNISLTLSILLLFAGGVKAHNLEYLSPKHKHLLSECIPEADPLRYKPLYKKPPRYPRKAQERGIEGTVLLEFTINKDGSVHNPTVVWSSSTDPKNPDIFNKSALIAAKEFRYQPELSESGQPMQTKGVQNQITFYIYGQENSLNLGKHNKQFDDLTASMNLRKREKSLKRIEKILLESNLSRLQRAAYLYLKAMYLYKDKSPNGQIIDVLVESKKNYVEEKLTLPSGRGVMSVTGSKLQSFAGILLGQMYLEESDWNSAASELEEALRAAKVATLQSNRFFSAYIQLGMAHYNLQNWCEASSSWRAAQKMGKKYGFSLPDALKEPMEFAQSKSN